ncbi:MAG: CHAD domain-containing protein [Acidobacteriaceae bacterium]|nr:CHAD domain-containing protein [Acidobacteriaceae bacterium]
MAYRFRSNESVPEGIQRIVREEVEDATKQLGNTKGAKRDEAIHEARKSIKKIRGAIRLMQPELGRIYRRENKRLGDAGRQLSDIRDAEAIIEVFDGVVEKYKAQLKPEAIRGIRRGLLKSKHETEQNIRVDSVVRQAVSALRGIGRDAAKWPLKDNGFDALAPGFKRRYRRGHKAMETARKQPAPETFHEWRKRVKDHWYHVRLLESLWTGVLQARESSLKELETWLGDDHNLVVLHEKLNADPARYGGEENVRLFTTLMDDYSKELREKSLSLGARIYEQKPKLLVREMSKLWDAWQSQPASMQDEKEQRAPARKGPAAARAVKRAVA